MWTDEALTERFLRARGLVPDQVVLLFVDEMETIVIEDAFEQYKHDSRLIVFIYNYMKNQTRKKVEKYQCWWTYELLERAEVERILTGHRFMPRLEKCHLERPDLDKFPRILTSDPHVRVYGWKTGDVIRIHRLDGSIGYRVVSTK